jgi:hypothetical protein
MYDVDQNGEVLVASQRQVNPSDQSRENIGMIQKLD